MYAYHVVTDRPMEIGQEIIFDETHHSGVYKRVHEKLDIVNDIYANPEKYVIFGFVNNKKIKQIGNITMDQMMFDLGDTEAEVGDVVTLLDDADLSLDYGSYDYYVVADNNNYPNEYISPIKTFVVTERPHSFINLNPNLQDEKLFQQAVLKGREQFIVNKIAEGIESGGLQCAAEDL